MSNSSCSDRTQALRLAGGQVLEPVMSLEVTVGEEYLGTVLGDLAQRRGTVRDIQSRHDDKTLLANVPLAEMMVSSTIRSIKPAAPKTLLFSKALLLFCTLSNVYTFKGLFHHPADTDIRQRHLLSRAGHL